MIMMSLEMLSRVALHIEKEKPFFAIIYLSTPLSHLIDASKPQFGSQEQSVPTSRDSHNNGLKVISSLRCQNLRYSTVCE